MPPSALSHIGGFDRGGPHVIIPEQIQHHAARRKHLRIRRPPTPPLTGGIRNLRELKDWVRRNKDHKYVPSQLLELWDFDVDDELFGKTAKPPEPAA